MSDNTYLLLFASDISVGLGTAKCHQRKNSCNYAQLMFVFILPVILVDYCSSTQKDEPGYGFFKLINFHQGQILINVDVGKDWLNPTKMFSVINGLHF